MNEMVESNNEKLIILILNWPGYSISKIVEFLTLEYGISISRHSLCLFLKWYKDRETIPRKQGWGCPLKLSPAIQQIIESAMQEDDEVTATQHQARLATHKIFVSWVNTSLDGFSTTYW